MTISYFGIPKKDSIIFRFDGRISLEAYEDVGKIWINISDGADEIVVFSEDVPAITKALEHMKQLASEKWPNASKYRFP